MQDAVLLANHLYDIKPTCYENIKKALCEYKEERFGAIKDQYPQSYVAAKLIYGHVSLDFLPYGGYKIFCPVCSNYDNVVFLVQNELLNVLSFLGNRRSRSERYDRSCSTGCPSRCK